MSRYQFNQNYPSKIENCIHLRAICITELHTFKLLKTAFRICGWTVVRVSHWLHQHSSRYLSNMKFFWSCSKALAEVAGGLAFHNSRFTCTWPLVSTHPPPPGASPLKKTRKRTPQEVWEASFLPEELLPWIPSDLSLSIPTHNLCYICLEDMNSGTIVRVIGCGHSFHFDCIILWLKLNLSFPTCKAAVH